MNSKPEGKGKPSQMGILSVVDIHKSFGKTNALKGVTFEINEGEIAALLGPSGCGKSTLLSIIAGLETPDRGDILWQGVSINNVPPHLREFGLMFQDFALFPHMNVYMNIAFGLKMAHLDSDKITSRVNEMLNLVNLPDFAKRDVNTLSGGEQQRVALARALAPHPHLLMLDEPLGSLDRNLRERLVVDLKKILKQMDQTAIYVTHDQEEAFTIADRIILMNAGKIEQIGTPHEIYCQPASSFVARFLDMTNLIPGNVFIKNGQHMVETSLGAFPISHDLSGRVEVLIRPEEARLDAHGPYHLSGTLKEISFRGNWQRASIDVQGTLLSFEFPTRISLPAPGTGIELSLDPSAFIAYEVYPSIVND